MPSSPHSQLVAGSAAKQPSAARISAPHGSLSRRRAHVVSHCSAPEQRNSRLCAQALTHGSAAEGRAVLAPLLTGELSPTVVAETSVGVAPDGSSTLDLQPSTAVNQASDTAPNERRHLASAR
jgi:hypothetical protein